MQQRDDETASPRVELNKSLRRNIYNVITIESPGDTDFVVEDFWFESKY